MRHIFALLAVALMISTIACGDAQEDPTPQATSGADTTPAPDTSNAVAPEQALEELRQEPALAPVVEAIQTNNVEGLLAQLDWQPTLCSTGESRRPVEACAEGSDTSAPIPMINAGDVVEFWVSEQTLRPYLELLLKDEGVGLTYLGRSLVSDARYFVGYDGPAKGRMFPPLGSGDTELTGMFLYVDSTAKSPVARLTMTTATYDSLAVANDARQVEAQEIVALHNPGAD